MSRAGMVFLLAATTAAACADNLGLARQYEDPQWPCRDDAVADADGDLCWLRCQPHQIWTGAQCTVELPDGDAGPPAIWGVNVSWEDAELACSDKGYAIPGYEAFLALLDSCEPLSAADAGAADGGAGPEETAQQCARCIDSERCSELFGANHPNDLSSYNYWTSTRCPWEDDPLDNPEAWRGRWAVDFGTGLGACVRRSQSTLSVACAHAFPFPWPSSI